MLCTKTMDSPEKQILKEIRKTIPFTIASKNSNL
jgi:hypothetical protein